MPWCETCTQYLAPNALTEEGDCPKCGNQCEAAQKNGTAKNGTEKSHAPKARKRKIPWHLWVLIIVLGVYLTWRLIQLLLYLF